MRDLRVVFLLVTLGCGEARGPVSPATALSPLEVSGFGANPGLLKMYLLVPPTLKPGGGLVVALHGCLQRAADFQLSGLNELAAAQGFAVLYPQTTASDGCFRWFEPQDTARNSGQTRSIVEAVDWVVQRYGLNRRQVFVTGLSAGAALAAALLATHPDVFSAGALFAGVPVGCAASKAQGLGCMRGVDRTPGQWAAEVLARAPPGAPTPRVMVVTGTADLTVAPSNAVELVEQWTAVNGVDSVADRSEDLASLHSAEYLDDQGLTRVWSVTLAGMGHALPIDRAHACGASAPFLSDVGFCGVGLAVRFFGLASVDVELISSPALDAGAGSVPVDAGLTSSFDAGLQLARCVESRDTPMGHLFGGRGTSCGFFASVICGRGSGETLGTAASWLPVWAHSTKPDEWLAGRCR